jgi:hypothetical protein
MPRLQGRLLLGTSPSMSTKLSRHPHRSLSRIAWLIGRLRGMRTTEIGHRIREAGRKRTTRHRLQGWERYPHAPATCPALPGLLERIDRSSSATQQAIASSAAELLCGHFEVLGVRWPDGSFDMRFPASTWTLDPRTGRSWPGGEHYCFDIGYRMEQDIGDVKYVWELGRLQFLPVLAADARLNGNARVRPRSVRSHRQLVRAQPALRRRALGRTA